MTLHVAVLANLKKNAPRYAGMPDDAWDDLDSEITVERHRRGPAGAAGTRRPSSRATSR